MCDLLLKAGGGLALSLVVAAPAMGLPHYDFLALDSSGFTSLQVRDVANGFAVGYGVFPIGGNNFAQHAIAWPVNGAPRIDMSHGFQSEAIGVDNAGHVAGDVRFSGIILANPGYWSSPTAAPEDYTGNLNYGQANATQGDKLIGWGRRQQAPNPVADSAFVWSVPSKNRTPLPSPAGGPTYGRDIDGNWVTGNAYLGTDGNPSAAAWEISDVNNPHVVNLHPAGFNYSTTSAVRGVQAVGLARAGAVGEDFNHAYLWNVQTGAARDLHALLPASLGAIASSASDVIGPIVVGSIWRGGEDLEPVIWNTNTNQVQNLREFLPAGSTFATGVAINDNGQIAGDFRYADGTRGAFILTPHVLPGDATFDGTVDIGDFAILAANFNRPNGDWGVADFNADGMTNLADFSLVASNFNQSAGTALRTSSSVPEPAGVTVGALATILLRRRLNNRAKFGD